ncbi:putative oxidoreductase YusZ [Psilocybe cubensis]|uniref:Oxidoreductase YusZ n=2 Tax=Psilocybe cubensis TaxID=181762 RepID=A0ACB8GM78_PSICU|nr:putative oxidoreductase YusZ [Psilocybe cubensis]KAH9476306.1 putative oxidoreductase YusZ [Psilocybe cubensis]
MAQSSLEDNRKVWLITGASSGFGKRLVTSILARGDLVIATARSLDKLESVISELDSQYMERLRTLQLDVTDGEEKIKTKIDQAITFWKRIDVLVNNAGFGVPGMVEEGGTKILRRQFETNVFGTLDVTTATLPYLRESNGCVVVIGSRSAWKAELPGLGFYAASKAAIHAITEAFMSELAQFNIKVLLVAPGSFRTEGIYGHSYYTDNPIPAYDKLRGISKTRFESVGGTEKGDPDKAVKAIIEVVTGEGRAKDRPWPNYLILGEDAEADVRNKCRRWLTVLDEWSDVTRAVNFDS